MSSDQTIRCSGRLASRIGFGLLALAGTYAVAKAPGFGLGAGGAGWLPLISGTVLILGCAYMALKGRHDASTTQGIGVPNASWISTLTLICILIAYVLLFKANFLFANLVMVCAISWLIRPRLGLSTVGLLMCIVGCVFVVVKYGFGVGLPLRW